MRKFITLTLACLLLLTTAVSAAAATDVPTSFDGDTVTLTVAFGADSANMEATAKLYRPNKALSDLLADNSNVEAVFAGLQQATTDAEGTATFKFEIEGDAGQYRAEFTTRKTAAQPIEKSFIFAPSSAVEAAIAELAALTYSAEGDNSAALAAIENLFVPVPDGVSGSEILGLSETAEYAIYEAFSAEQKAGVHETLLYAFSVMDEETPAEAPTKTEVMTIFSQTVLTEEILSKDTATLLEEILEPAVDDQGVAIPNILEAYAAALGLDAAPCYTELFLEDVAEAREDIKDNVADSKAEGVVTDAITTLLTTDWTPEEKSDFAATLSECIFMSNIKAADTDEEIGAIMAAVPDYLTEIGISDTYASATNQKEVWQAAAGSTSLDSFVSAINSNISTEAVTPGTTPGTTTTTDSSGRGSGGRGGSGSIAGASTVISNPLKEVDAAPAFSDLVTVPWAEEAIAALAEDGVLNGKEPGLFYPNDEMKREEIAKVLTLAFDLSGQSDAAFKDVDSAAWYYEYVMKASASGVIQGDGESFGIGSSLTRQDLVTMVGRILESRLTMPEAGEVTFSDSADISEYAKQYVAWLYELGVVSGVGDNSFEPLRPITRAEVAKIIYTVLKEVASA